jgi:8-amino-7-oxononanoate synthase
MRSRLPAQSAASGAVRDLLLCRAVLDFASSLYLGLRHDSSSLARWESFTAGVPAALAEAPEASRLARQLARLQGCERATLAPSTLHLFWDLFGWLSRRPIAIYMDEGTYATGRWGAERAASRGVPVRRFRHHDVDALEHQLADARAGRVPVVLADGF